MVTYLPAQQLVARPGERLAPVVPNTSTWNFGQGVGGVSKYHLLVLNSLGKQEWRVDRAEFIGFFSEEVLEVGCQHAGYEYACVTPMPG